jgi:surface carbohydrate biosynthesis protein
MTEQLPPIQIGQPIEAKQSALSKVKKILMFSHLPTRDDVVDTMLTQELKNMGHMVWKGSILVAARENILTLKPDVVILPEIRCRYTAAMVNNLTSWGVQTVIKRCEAGANWTMYNAMPECDRITLFGQYDYDATLELVWGDEFAKILKDKHGKQNVKTIGAIVFDPYFLPRPPIPKATDKKTMLWATGFVYADRHSDYCAPEVDMGDYRHNKWWRQCRDGRAKYIDAIKELQKEMGDEWYFFIRLKCGESPVEYQQRLGDTVILTPGEPVVASLMRTDLVIHAGSTMAYEAHMMDIPTLSYYGYPVIGYEGKSSEYLPLHIAPKTQSLDQLKKMIKSVKLGKSNANLDIIKQLDKEYYGQVDGKAHKRAAEAINELPPCNPQIPDQWPETPLGTWPIGHDVWPQAEQWVCNACHKPFWAKPGHDMRPCPWCGVSLVKLMVKGQPQ